MGMGLRIRLGVGFVGQCLGGLGFRIRVHCLGLWGWAQGYYCRGLNAAAADPDVWSLSW